MEELRQEFANKVMEIFEWCDEHKLPPADAFFIIDTFKAEYLFSSFLRKQQERKPRIVPVWKITQ